jgi:hypothetical protein
LRGCFAPIVLKKSPRRETQAILAPDGEKRSSDPKETPSKAGNVIHKEMKFLLQAG